MFGKYTLEQNGLFHRYAKIKTYKMEVFAFLRKRWVPIPIPWLLNYYNDNDTLVLYSQN